MKTAKHFCFTLLLTLALFSCGEEPSRAASQLLEALPASNLRSFEPEIRGDSLILTLRDSVFIENLINQDFRDPGTHEMWLTQQNYQPNAVSLTISFSPWSSAWEQDAAEQNQQILKKLEFWQERLQHIPHKFDEYLPRTREDSILVMEFEIFKTEAKKDLKRFPEGIFEGKGLTLTRSWQEFEAVHPEDASAKLDAMIRAIKDLCAPLERK